MKIALGYDHAGFNLIKPIKDFLTKKGHTYIDYTNINNDNEKIDYPIPAQKVALSIKNKQADKGILICGTGIGMSIAANKIKGIRAAKVNSIYEAQMCINHNNSNIITIGARVTKEKDAIDIINTFLISKFEGNRHQKRIDLITEIENNKKK